MKNSHILFNRKILSIFLMSIIWISGEIKAQSNNKNLIETWERARDYSLEVARIMPENLYDYAPRKNLLTFREQWLHVIDNITNFHYNKILNQEPKTNFANPENLTKDELLKHLEQTFNEVKHTLKKMPPESLNKKVKFRDKMLTKKKIIYLIRDHNTHHRAQSILYLRLNGFEPPSYVGW